MLRKHRAVLKVLVSEGVIGKELIGEIPPVDAKRRLNPAHVLISNRLGRSGQPHTLWHTLEASRHQDGRSNSADAQNGRASGQKKASQQEEASQQIIKSAVDLVLGTAEPETPLLSPTQVHVWKTLLPILAERGLLALKAGGLALAEDVPMDKKKAAEFLGLTVRKLEVCMAGRQLQYQKYGAGKSASVRFQRSELEKFRESRKMAKRNQQSR